MKKRAPGCGGQLENRLGHEDAPRAGRAVGAPDKGVKRLWPEKHFVPSTELGPRSIAGAQGRDSGPEAAWELWGIGVWGLAGAVGGKGGQQLVTAAQNPTASTKDDVNKKERCPMFMD